MEVAVLSESETAHCGIVLLTYRNIPLGFAKNIGSQANNLYPQERPTRNGYLLKEVAELYK